MTGRGKSEEAKCVNFARRVKLVPLHFQFDDHIPSGRKNVLRKLLRIPYRSFKAGFSVCWLCLFVAGVLSEMHEMRTFAPCKAFLFEMFAFFRRLRITLDSEQPMLKENGSFRQSEVE